MLFATYAVYSLWVPAILAAVFAAIMISVKPLPRA